MDDRIRRIITVTASLLTQQDQPGAAEFLESTVVAKAERIRTLGDFGARIPGTYLLGLYVPRGPRRPRAAGSPPCFPRPGPR